MLLDTQPLRNHKLSLLFNHRYFVRLASVNKLMIFTFSGVSSSPSVNKKRLPHTKENICKKGNEITRSNSWAHNLKLIGVLYSPCLTVTQVCQWEKTPPRLGSQLLVMCLWVLRQKTGTVMTTMLDIYPSKFLWVLKALMSFHWSDSK